MHVGSSSQKSKTEVMFFLPSSLNEAKTNTSLLQPDILLNNGCNSIHLQNPSNIFDFSSPQMHLTNEMKVNAWIQKASIQRGTLKHFFNAPGINWRVKYWIYLTGPINILLWGVESLLLSERNLMKFNFLPLSNPKNPWNLHWKNDWTMNNKWSSNSGLWEHLPNRNKYHP